MPADALATKVARASAGMVLTYSIYKQHVGFVLCEFLLSFVEQNQRYDMEWEYIFCNLGNNSMCQELKQHAEPRQCKHLPCVETVPIHLWAKPLNGGVNAPSQICGFSQQC